MKQNFYINFLQPTGRERLLMHCLFWLLLFFVRFYLTVITFNVYRGFPLAQIFLLNISSTVLIVGVYYFTIRFVGKCLADRRWILAFGLAVAIMLIYTTTDSFLEGFWIEQCVVCMNELQRQQPAYFALINRDLLNIVLVRVFSLGTPFLLLLSLSIPLSIRMALHSWRNQVNALHLAKSNVQLEFNFLKSQINPHFLFNTMNNIYGLIITGENVRSAALVARLSSVLRYMLYETNKDQMAIAGEFQLINDLVELEKIRLNETVVNSEISYDSTGYLLPPLLLVPLVENAFKFCPDTKGSFIRMQVTVKNGLLKCQISNSVAGHTIEKNVVSGGIGLANLKQRLHLYFPDKHNYRTQVANHEFTVDLQINLS